MLSNRILHEPKSQVKLAVTLLNTHLADSMASNNLTDYKALFLEAERKQKQAEERQKQAEERQKQAEERQRQTEEQIRRTTFGELTRYGHDIVAKSLRVDHQSRCTSGKISAPIGKKCPRKLHP